MIVNKTQKNKGFTLIELMVAISIFMMIMIMAMGAVIVASDASKKADKLRTAMDNVNFAMESMTRSIRMGTSYDASGGNFSFTSSEQKNISYKVLSKKLQRCISPSPCVDMVSSEVEIDKLDFTVKGVGVGGEQPSVYIIMKGTVNMKGASYSFALQTMASQRNLEQ